MEEPKEDLIPHLRKQHAERSNPSEVGCSVLLAEKNHKSVLDTIKDRGWTELPECIKSSNLRILSTSASLEKTE